MSSTHHTNGHHHGNNHPRRQGHYQQPMNGSGNENRGHPHHSQNGHQSNYQNTSRNRRSLQPRPPMQSYPENYIPQDTAAATLRQNAAAKLARAAWKRHSMTEAPQDYHYMQYANHQQRAMLSVPQALTEDDMAQLSYRLKRLSMPTQPRLPSYYYEQSDINAWEQNPIKEENCFVEEDPARFYNGGNRSKRSSIIEPNSPIAGVANGGVVASATTTAIEGETTILDVYDFPASFKTHHLHDIFRGYENMRGGYRIKWLEDTRALIIFEHPATAKKAYLENVNNPLAKVKPYTGSLDILRRNNGNKTRPQTTDAVARRLVNGALGVRGPRNQANRDAERQSVNPPRDNSDMKSQQGSEEVGEIKE
ncbi:uncharacterized protein VTP21DRAFT_942 [Calcarisporiella thermophila]|uniref:uncharacterized protein n=1 Tax=Calcarisporiella thermophila TaxID=911321 RepID=UPI0037423B25